MGAFAMTPSYAGGSAEGLATTCREAEVGSGREIAQRLRRLFAEAPPQTLLGLCSAKRAEKHRELRARQQVAVGEVEAMLGYLQREWTEWTL